MQLSSNFQSEKPLNIKLFDGRNSKNRVIFFLRPITEFELIYLRWLRCFLAIHKLSVKKYNKRIKNPSNEIMKMSVNKTEFCPLFSGFNVLII